MDMRHEEQETDRLVDLSRAQWIVTEHRAYVVERRRQRINFALDVACVVAALTVIFFLIRIVLQW